MVHFAADLKRFPPKMALIIFHPKTFESEKWFKREKFPRIADGCGLFFWNAAAYPLSPRLWKYSDSFFAVGYSAETFT